MVEALDCTDDVFRFPNHERKNAFYVYKGLGEVEKYVCCRLVGAGPLGWNRRSIQAAHLRFSDVRALVQKQIVVETTLLRLAGRLVRDDDSTQRKAELEKQGGFIAAGRDDQRFISDFDTALELVRERRDPRGQEIRFQVTRRQGLYDYVGLLLDERQVQAMVRRVIRAGGGAWFSSLAFL